MSDLDKMLEQSNAMVTSMFQQQHEAMVKDWLDGAEAAKPFNWQLANTEDLSEETHGAYRVAARRLTWNPPERNDAHWMNFHVRPKPDGLDDNNSAVRWYIYGDKFHDYDYHIFGTEERCREFLDWLQRRDANIPAIERAIKVFDENGFHHGEYYQPCEQNMTCRHCVAAAMEILSL